MILGVIYAASNLLGIGQLYSATVLSNKMLPSHREHLIYLTFFIRDTSNFSVLFLI